MRCRRRCSPQVRGSFGRVESAGFRALSLRWQQGDAGVRVEWLGDASEQCRCTPPVIERYRARVSGPLLDRIDLHVEVTRVAVVSLAEEAPGSEPSATIRPTCSGPAPGSRPGSRVSASPSTRNLPGREVRRMCRSTRAGGGCSRLPVSGSGSRRGRTRASCAWRARSRIGRARRISPRRTPPRRSNTGASIGVPRPKGPRQPAHATPSVPRRPSDP